MHAKTRLALLLAAAALAGCGRVAPLQPADGQPLPVKPLMAQTVPTAEDLLERPSFARPERVDELIRRSEPRRSDKFDLPPADGAPLPLPVDTDGEDRSSEELGPATPEGNR